MRSAFVFLTGIPRDAVVSFLDETARRTEHGWQVGAVGAPALYIGLHSNGFEDFEPEDLRSATDALGQEPELLMMVDVSGRIDGYNEVVSFVISALERFGGIAQDDHWAKAWTKDELNLVADRQGGSETFFRGPNSGRR
jgi:hypothetical protein